MYATYAVDVPQMKTGISRKKIKGTVYVYFEHGRVYKADKKYNVPQCTSIGKVCADDPDRMFPNQNYYRYFPEAEIPVLRDAVASRSGCLRIGTFLVIRKIIAGYHLDSKLEKLIGKDSGLFLDLAAYSIVCENNAGQYYPDYAYCHPLFTEKMKIYSDSKVSRFINEIKRDQSIAFQNEWNSRRDHREKIYISYDSTNKNCQAGEIELAEIGHAKNDIGKPIVNFAVAYDNSNSEPLFYEEYPGSIVDVAQLQIMLEKAAGYGYRHVGFILDRGYFSKGNIRYMDSCGYEFIIMVRGMKEFVKEMLLEYKGKFEEDRACSIRDYKVSGITVKRRLYPSDEKDRYFHIYYNSRRYGAEREQTESRIDRMAEALKKCEGKQVRPEKSFEKYFDLIYYHEGKEDEKFVYARERTDKISEEISLCGYFVIITSEKMTAEEALELYKSRDASEKLFRGDKSYLGNKSFRIQSNESLHAKIFIEFVALIIRNKMHLSLKELKDENGKRQNYMTVPAAIRELEKIEMIRQPDGDYRMDYAVTRIQKELLKAFDITATQVRQQAAGLNEELKRINTEV